jgi:hypothetical protein
MSEFAGRPLGMLGGGLVNSWWPTRAGDSHAPALSAWVAGLGFKKMIMYEAPYVPTPAATMAKEFFLGR